MKIQICTKCKIEKPLSEFHKDKSRKNGLCPYCKDCVKLYKIEKKEELKKYQKEYRKNNKENIAKYHKEWHGLNKNKIKQYCQENKEKRSEYDKEYQFKNAEKIKKQKQEYYEEHKEETLERSKKHYLKNKPEIAKYQKEHSKQKYHTDINFKIISNLRTRLTYALKGNNKSKSKRTLKLLGCTIEELKIHLESKFTKGMTWDNHGNGCDGKGLEEWHMDHIKPCAKFDLSKKSEQEICFNYTNLQPLWAEDNRKKSSN